MFDFDYFDHSFAFLHGIRVAESDIKGKEGLVP